jgi:peptidase M28-like protein
VEVLNLRLALLASLIALIAVISYGWLIHMPGRSYSGKFLPLRAAEQRCRDELKRHVEMLAGEIGERHLLEPAQLSAAAEYLRADLSASGYEVHRQAFQVNSQECYNLEVELPGTVRPEEIVIVGAHYDSAYGTPGANDNASGSAATLALARTFAGENRGRTIRFVLFVNEEPPYFQTPSMGSVVYAKRCRERDENVTAMLSLETIGYYSDEPGSQNYPFPIGLLFPSTANFIGFVGNPSSRDLTRGVIDSFRSQTRFPSEGVSAPNFIPGIGWSDHWSFWQEGYAAVMVTDTALFRYRHYHTADDTVDKVDFDRTARVVVGLERVIDDLATVGS